VVVGQCDLELAMVVWCWNIGLTVGTGGLSDESKHCSGNATFVPEACPLVSSLSSGLS